MSTISLASVATRFVLNAIQEWGDPPEARIAAVQAVLDSAGFDARATCWPVFGGIWKSPCEGPDAEAASAWLRNLTDTMQRGKMEDEIAHVEAALRAVPVEKEDAKS